VSTFDDNERSISENRPIELYEITTPTTTHRHTSGTVGVVFSAFLYTPLTMDHDALRLGSDSSSDELTLTLPITHPLVQQFCSSGIPEHSVTVTVRRMQTSSAQTIQQCSGFAQGLSVSGHMATIRVPSLMNDAIKIKLPVIGAQKTCNHVLFDAQCTMDRSSFSGAFLIIAISGLNITTTTLNASPYYLYGDVIHLPTLQIRMVVAHSGSTLTLNAPIVGATPGDSIVAAAGCAHDVTTCRDKFSNVINFGGHPGLDAFNPWYLHGLGVVQQT
jgi:hypothetical protein